MINVIIIFIIRRLFVIAAHESESACNLRNPGIHPVEKKDCLNLCPPSNSPVIGLKTKNNYSPLSATKKILITSSLQSGRRRRRAAGGVRDNGGDLRLPRGAGVRHRDGENQSYRPAALQSARHPHAGRRVRLRRFNGRAT